MPKFIMLPLVFIMLSLARCERDVTLFMGNFHMYEGRWSTFENTTATNLTQVPMLDELNFKNSKSGLVQGIIFDNTVNLLNILDNGNLNHIVQVVFQDYDHVNVLLWFNQVYSQHE